MDQSQERSTALDRLFSPGSRKGFLVSLGAASLAACGGGLSGIKTLSGDILCGPPTCKGGGGGYDQTGGVNPNQWTNYSHVSLPSNVTGTFTRGWNDGSVVAHGANNATGGLVYTGSTAYGLSGGSASITHNLTVTNGPTFSGTGTLPTTLPMEGTFNLTLAGVPATCTVDAANDKMTLNFSVQGYPTQVVITQTDSSGQNFNAQITQNGKTYNVPMWFPVNLYQFKPQSARRRPDNFVCDWLLPVLSVAGGGLGLLLALAGPLGWAADATIAALTWMGIGFGGQP